MSLPADAGFLAADALVAADIDLSRFAAACPSIDPFTVEVRRAPWPVRAVLPRGVAAIALPRVIYVMPDVLRSAKRDLAPLVAHELVHVAQWKDHGVFAMGSRYLADYLRGRGRRQTHWESYRAVRFEREARAGAAYVCGEEV